MGWTEKDNTALAQSDFNLYHTNAQSSVFFSYLRPPTTWFNYNGNAGTSLAKLFLDFGYAQHEKAVWNSSPFVNVPYVQSALLDKAEIFVTSTRSRIVAGIRSPVKLRSLQRCP